MAAEKRLPVMGIDLAGMVAAAVTAIESEELAVEFEDPLASPSSPAAAGAVGEWDVPTPKAVTLLSREGKSSEGFAVESRSVDFRRASDSSSPKTSTAREKGLSLLLLPLLPATPVPSVDGFRILLLDDEEEPDDGPISDGRNNCFDDPLHSAASTEQ